MVVPSQLSLSPFRLLGHLSRARRRRVLVRPETGAGALRGGMGK